MCLTLLLVVLSRSRTTTSASVRLPGCRLGLWAQIILPPRLSDTPIIKWPVEYKGRFFAESSGSNPLPWIIPHLVEDNRGAVENVDSL
ncbi:hypothetical protein LIA77_02980 [Sarocladium implicatum]|nr:hypothetical protein LIA77_02980 [Sarocladium implicatum]